MTTTELITGSELARRLGVNQARISMAAGRGQLTVASRTAAGQPRFDPAVAISEWKAVEDHNNRQGRREQGNRSSIPPRPETVEANAALVDGVDDTPHIKLTKAKAIRESLEAQLAKLRLEEARGKLVGVEQVKQDAAGLGSFLIGALLALPLRVSAELAAMSDAHEIDLYLQREINEMILAIRRQCDVPEDEIAGADKKK